MRLLERIARLCHRGASFPQTGQEVVTLLRRSIPHHVCVGIYVVEGKELVLGPWDGPRPTERRRIPIGDGVHGAVAAQGEARVVDDVGPEPIAADSFPTRKSAIVVPILHGGTLVGEIDVCSDKPAAFHETDRLLLERVAELLAECWGADPTAHPRGPATMAIHAGEELPEGLRPVGFPVVAAATYAFADLDEMKRVVADNKAGYLYGRWGNPTVRSAEAKLRALDGAGDALLFSSGMGAISATLLALLGQGETLVASTALYGETLRLLGRLPRFGIRVVALEPEKLARIGDHLPAGTKAVYFEPLVNPTLRLVDPRPIAQACRARGIVTITDNTFATPYNLRPLALGVDLVIHSLTKYLSGHGDLTGGSVAGSEVLVAEVEPWRRSLGAAMSPFDAFLVSRGLKTFAVRMREHAANAGRIADFLSTHPRVRRVLYPGLASHPDHGLARELLDTPGGMVTFEIQGDQPAAEAFVNRLALCRCAASLGGVETLVSLPVLSSHHSLPEAQLAAAGVTRGMVRISVGLEEAGDVVADLTQAFG